MAGDETDQAGWLDLIEAADYRWDVAPAPASEREIARLIQFAGRPLPDDYIAFLRRHDGGTLWYRDIWQLRLWHAADIPSWSAAFGFTPAQIPGALVIGSDGGGEALVLDIRPERADGQYPVYAINFVSLDWDEAIAVAPDFRRLLLLRHGLLGP